MTKTTVGQSFHCTVPLPILVHSSMKESRWWIIRSFWSGSDRIRLSNTAVMCSLFIIFTNHLIFEHEILKIFSYHSASPSFCLSTAEIRSIFIIFKNHLIFEHEILKIISDHSATPSFCLSMFSAP